MKFLLNVPGMTLYPGRGEHWWKNLPGADMLRIAQHAEQLGYDYIVVPTHFVMQREAALEMGPRWVHSLSAANFLLGGTTRIKVLCLVVLPNHNPVELAKAVATADFLSAGRLIPVILAGYQPWEFEILNVPFVERGAITDEWLEAMFELWTNEHPSFAGKRVRFDDIVFEPKPTLPLDLWFGGATKAAVRRIARYGGSGWLNSQVPRARFRAMLDYIESQPGFRSDQPLKVQLTMFEGTFDSSTHVISGYPDLEPEREMIIEQIHAIASLGATVVNANEVLGTGRYFTATAGAPQGPRSLDEYLERVQWFAEEIMPAGRALGGPGRR